MRFRSKASTLTLRFRFSTLFFADRARRVVGQRLCKTVKEERNEL